MTLSKYKVEKLKRAYTEWALLQDSDSHAFSTFFFHDQIDEMVGKSEAFDAIIEAMEKRSALGISDGWTLIDIDTTINGFLDRIESGEE